MILALGFIILFAVIIRKCNERTLALRNRIQSFIVSEPGSVSLEHATEQELEQMEEEEEGEPVSINITDTSERNSQEPENETKNQRETNEESISQEKEQTSVELNDKRTKDL